jgi:hypothetical protein
MKYTDLTDEQKQQYSDCFYLLWTVEFRGAKDDLDSPLPWGCPWLWNKEDMPVDLVSVSALIDFKEHLPEIRKIMEDELNEEDE